MHTSRTGEQEITYQYIFKEKITKKNLINIRVWKLSLIGKETNYALCVRKLNLHFPIKDYYILR